MNHGVWRISGIVLRSVYLIKKGWLLALVVIGLVSCGTKSDLQQELDEYIERLSRTLDISPNPSGPIGVMRIDAPPVDIPRVKISLLEFLRLFGCELQYTVGERNSSLGRVATGSQRLLNTLQMLRQAPDCMEILQSANRSEDAARLRELMRQKKQQLPALIYNAILAGPEFRELWSPLLPEDYPVSTNSSVIDALDQLVGHVTRWLNGDYLVDGVELELLLKELRKGDAGALIQALAIYRSGLIEADGLIESRLALRPVCLTGAPNDVSRTFERVVSRYFIGAIQIRQATIHRRQFELLAAVRRLEGLVKEVQPQRYRNWVADRERILENAQAAPRDHVVQIKKLLQQCGSGFGS